MLTNIKTLSIVIIAAVLILLTTVIPGKLNILQQQKANYETLDVKAFKEKYQASKNAVMLDVRTPEEFAESKIDDAVQIDYYRQDFHEQLDKLDNTKEYFVYCQGGERGGKTCDYLTKKGIKCYNLKGGLDAWNEEK